MDTTYYTTAGGTLVFGRGGHAPSPPALVANVVLRLVLCPLAVLLTWVPLRILWRNGEFPACVFVLCTWAMMLFVFVNAAVWHNQDFDAWWLGYGWCDLQAYVGYALTTAYCACVCAIMQRLASQVGLTRVSGLSSREKRRRLAVQAAIIFPLPVLQIAITVFVQGIRYAIVPATGCTNQYDATAVFLVFFILPSPLLTFVACFHTFQVYRRFREVDMDSRAALAGTNSVAFLRRQRARRKLYFMVICILVPFTPIIIAFCAVNIVAGWPWNYPSGFAANHLHGPNPWNSVGLLGYADVNFLAINMGWIPVVSAYIAFVFFGTSKEAINVYRAYLLALGLGRVFPRLREPYDPDRSGATSLFDSTGSSAATQLTALTCSTSRKGSGFPGSFSSFSETGSQSHFLAAVVSRDDDDGGDIVQVQRPPPSRFRQWCARAPPPGAPPGAPPARTPFNPGLNWLAPLTAGSYPFSAAGAPRPTWKPVAFGPRAHQTTASGSSDLGTALQGQQAVSTHVWSDGEDGVVSSNTTNNTRDSYADGPASEQPRGIVHVERSITSQVQ